VILNITLEIADDVAESLRTNLAARVRISRDAAGAVANTEPYYTKTAEVEEWLKEQLELVIRQRLEVCPTPAMVASRQRILAEEAVLAASLTSAAVVVRR
jgi:hypothetical protein